MKNPDDEALTQIYAAVALHALITASVARMTTVEEGRYVLDVTPINAVLMARAVVKTLNQKE